MKSGSARGAMFLCAAFLAGGCGGSLDQSFDLAYLTYARPDYPYGSLVVAGYSPTDGWQVRQEAELSRNAVLLFQPPYVTGGMQYLAVESDEGRRFSSLWQWPREPGSEPQKLFELQDRVVLLWANSPNSDAATFVYVTSSQVDLRSAEYDREVVSLRANARCSVAVVRYGQPDSLLLLGSCRYASPRWFSPGRTGYITHSGTLVAVELDSLHTDTLARSVGAFSVAAKAGSYAVFHRDDSGDRGDSIVLFDAQGVRTREAIPAVSAPQLSPDGVYLAYHADDHGVWIRTLASGEVQEVGVGYPVAWSQAGSLLLFYERQADDRRVTHTLFHVAAAENGAVASLPADGFIVDAAFWR
jgi:hypothetical protein